MFVRESTLIATLVTNAELTGTNAGLRAQLASAQTTVDWLRTRVNQLEKERAVLLREVTHLNIPIPEIATPGPVMSTAVPASLQMPNFEDIGDDAASKLGITHNDAGELEYVG